MVPEAPKSITRKGDPDMRAAAWASGVSAVVVDDRDDRDQDADDHRKADDASGINRGRFVFDLKGDRLFHSVILSPGAALTP
jgi:hypothetical protein